MPQSSVTQLPTAEWQARVDLAAAFRWAARLDWHEAVANHFSLAVSQDGGRFLMNPRWRHFSLLKASDLMLIDVDDNDTMKKPDAPDPSAWCIHGALHRLRPEIRCVLHVHSPYATALASIEDSRVLPIDQNSMRFFNRIAYDEVYGGLAVEQEEGDRIADALGDKPILMMANHGVLVTGESVAQAFDELYYLERSCRNQVLAMSTGVPLRLCSDNMAQMVASSWADHVGFAEAHFAELKSILDRDEPDYAN